MTLYYYKINYYAYYHSIKVGEFVFKCVGEIDESSVLPPFYLQKMADGDSNVEEVLKVLLIGDSGVGKSSFLTMYCDDTFAPVFNQTVGIDFKKKTIERRVTEIILPT